MERRKVMNQTEVELAGYTATIAWYEDNGGLNIHIPSPRPTTDHGAAEREIAAYDAFVHAVFEQISSGATA